MSHSGAHHSFDMKKDMGGLKKYMPQTFWTFLIGSIALAGVFPFAGFWSKDEILVNAGHNGYKAFLIVGLVGAFMTAAYMTRCIYLTFFGEYRGGHARAAPKPNTSPTPSSTRRSRSTRTARRSAREQLAADDARCGCCRLRDLRRSHQLPALREVREMVPAAVRFFVENPPEVVFNPILAAISVADRAHRRRARVGVLHGPARRTARAQRSATPRARAGKRILVNKYYLDWLYTDVIVSGIKGPIAAASTGSTRRSSTTF